MDPRTDEQLLAAYVAGDRSAFERLVSRYTGELYGFFCRFVGNAAAADDLVQEAFLQVHLAARSFDPGRTFKPWLYTIAANKGRDYLRARGRRGEVSLEASAGEDGPALSDGLEASAPPAAEAVDAQSRDKLVRALIDQMPEHLRLILIMGYYQQLPYAEIAEILDVPVGTVKSRLHAAVNHFARLWHARVSASPAG